MTTRPNPKPVPASFDEIWQAGPDPSVAAPRAHPRPGPLAPPPPPSAPNPGIASRQHQRTPLNSPAVAHEVDEFGALGLGVPCTIIDISRSGAGFRSRRPMRLGRLVVVILTLSAGKPKPLIGVVRNCVYADEGQYQIGIQFVPAPASPAFQQGLMAMGLG